MPLYNINAIVLKRINLGEADRIVTLLSRERGKLSAVVKGSRKPASKFSGAAEIISYGKYQIATGTNLDIVVQVDIRETFPKIHSNLIRIAYASYFAEAANRFTEEGEVSADLFDFLLSSLYLLERPNNPEIIARMFDLQLMKEVGYEPVLDRCLRCNNQITDQHKFSPSAGGMICRKCGYLPDDCFSLSPDAIDKMKRLITADAETVEQMHICRETLDQIARAMRWYMRFRTEYELKSLQFLQILKLGEVQ